MTVLRYIERNPLGAGLVPQAEEWPWGSLGARVQADLALGAILSPWPVERPVDWIDRVNAAPSAQELGRIRSRLVRGRPFGAEDWVRRTVGELGLQHTIRPEGRPPKRSDPDTPAGNELRPCF